MTQQRWVLLLAALLLSACCFVVGVVATATLWRIGPTIGQLQATRTVESESRPDSVAVTETALPPAERAPTRTAEPQSTPTPSGVATTAPDGVAASSTLAEVEAALIPPRDLFEIAMRFGRIPADTPRVVSEVDPGYTLGDDLTFFVSDVDSGEYFEVEATLRAQTAHASWWVESGAEVDQADLDASARVFEERSYPTNRALFGSEWTPGIDGDPRVHVFLGEVPGVGGYYSSTDEFPRTVNPFSNEKEIFYINLDNAEPGNDYFDGILAHEFQHMIHWSIDRNEELWINEGLSELAAKVNGFDVGDAVSSFARDTDIPVTRWDDQTYPFYGSAFLFLSYFHQHFGEDAVRALVQNTEDGPESFDEILAPHGMTFDDLFAQWATATLLNDPALDEGRLSFDESFQSPSMAQTIKQYPLIDRGEVHQYGLDYLRFDSSAAGPLTLEFTGDSTVRLLPTEAHSGSWMAWGNRGDDGNTYLTRAFDLRDISSNVTLRFWSWYDLELDYDYAYISISTDGGERWQILPATDTTEENPHGSNFGHAFTGASGYPGQENEDVTPIWREQTVDLSPFVGQEVQLRFEVITDDALNRNGFVVDDVSIPQLNYVENFEAGLGGWEPDGFAWVDNVLPQRFIVQIVAKAGRSTLVVPLPLDERNHATFLLEGFGTTYTEAILIVSGATSFTSERAGYSYSARLGEP
ncbi:MAG: immune inhibitor A [Ardenticatenales bacterium]|nr:immune inhibitor A [Ardenticatenales bacterium]